MVDPIRKHDGEDGWQASTPTGVRRRFRCLIQAEVEIEVDQTIIDQGLSADYRNNYYHHADANDVVSHLVFNLVGRQTRLQNIDGFANAPETSAETSWYPDWEVEVEQEIPALVAKIEPVKMRVKKSVKKRGPKR